MSEKIIHIITAISSAFGRSKKTKEEEPPLPTRLFTFFIQGEGIRKSVNVKAHDRLSAEQKIQSRYPNCTADFLWELIRSPH